MSTFPESCLWPSYIWSPWNVFLGNINSYNTLRFAFFKWDFQLLLLVTVLHFTLVSIKQHGQCFPLYCNCVHQVNLLCMQEIVSVGTIQEDPKLVAVRSEVLLVQSLYCVHSCVLSVWHWLSLNFWGDQHILPVCKAWFPQDHGPSIGCVVPRAAVELHRGSSSMVCA